MYRACLGRAVQLLCPRNFIKAAILAVWHLHRSKLDSCNGSALGAQAEAHHHHTVLCNGSANGPSNGVCAPAPQWQWVNYFLHTGHLSIAGLKMSKSLKNFITIRWVPLRLLHSQKLFMPAWQYGCCPIRPAHAIALPTHNSWMIIHKARSSRPWIRVLSLWGKSRVKVSQCHNMHSTGC